MKKKRGLAIIINCDYDGSPPEKNLGLLRTTNQDGNEMYKTLHDHLDYDVHRIQNKDATKKNVTYMLQSLSNYLRNEYDGSEKNVDGNRKAIVFAFAGHGDSDGLPDHILTHDGERMFVINDIVRSFLGNKKPVMDIPKIFLFDACRGIEWLTAATGRGEDKDNVNYRIDYATISEHKAPTADRWMQLIAKTLREKDVSFGDVMAIVKKEVYETAGVFPQQPETLDRLVTGPLKLYYRKR